MSWTDDRVESLKKLWLDGLSASQIAKQLGGGISRNAVIGKVHRLGLSGRAAPSQPSRPIAKPVRPHRPALTSVPVRRVEPLAVRTAPAPRPLVEVVPEEVGSATVLTLGAHMCKWPIGDPSSDTFAFCGRPSGDEGPYCRAHAQVAYQPPQKRTKRAEINELTRSLRRYI